MRREAEQRERNEFERAQREQKREKRVRRVTLAAIALVAVSALAISLLVATTRSTAVAERVAERVAPQVAAAVVQDARAQRVEVGRRKLGEANTQLIARNLPIVADPGDTATGDELIIAASTARVLSILPESTVARLRDEVASGRTPRVLPSAALSSADAGELGDITVTVLPEDEPPVRSRSPRSSGSGTGAGGSGPGPARPGPATRAPSAPAPAPAAPPSRDGGLLRPCLLGTVLC